MCDCVIAQAVQGPGEKNFTEHTGAWLASKLQKFDEEGVFNPELKDIPFDTANHLYQIV